MLKRMIVENVPARLCDDESLAIYKNVWRKLRVESDMLMCDLTNVSVPVVPMNFMINTVREIHCQMAHVGKHKLLNLVSRMFYHPSLKQIVVDLTRSCSHCQLYKVSSQCISPPIIKIVSNYPFDLVAIDIMQFPKSSSGCVAVLVCVDHFSKFLYAMPLRDKKASSVCKALRNVIFPTMIRLPTRMLSDNGPEFRSDEFERTLSNLNIIHVFSTRYRAQSNGAVERGNRTIAEFVKGVVCENLVSWDEALARAVIVYNSTWHVSIGMSPTDLILRKSHNCNVNIPVISQSINSWKEAHPKFKSFALNSKVALKINKIGNQLRYKLEKKFTGPFTVTKIQGNGVTYEISDGISTIKAHHRQLKPWFDPPDYLRRCLGNSEKKVVNDHVVLSGDDSEDSDSSGAFIEGFYAETGSDTDHEQSDDFRFNGSGQDVKNLGECILFSYKSVFNRKDCEEFYDLRAKSYLYEIMNTVPKKVVSDTQMIMCVEDSIDWSFGDVQEEVNDELSEVVNCRVSTPVDPDNTGNQLELSRSISDVHGTDAGLVDVTSRSSDGFWLWLEQSISVQEDMLDQVVNVSNSLNDGWIEDVSDVIGMGDMKSVNERKNALEAMRDHLKHVRENVRNFREGKNERWRERFECRNVSEEPDILIEASDIVTQLPKNVTAGMRTRSQGLVESHPNVQSNILEYELMKQGRHQ
jgi:transposase InsO family protein